MIQNVVLLVYTSAAIVAGACVHWVFGLAAAPKFTGKHGGRGGT
jgi:hypothetical protein